MSKQSSRFDAAYLDKKRHELIRLRERLHKAAESAQIEETEVKRESNSQALEYEDEAQQLDMLETAGRVVVRDLRRLAQVDRALEKIAEGTYGLSDVSGEQIPDERLQAIPDAINTLAEQEAIERQLATSRS
jgi:DnaK suppressor protein